MSEEISQAIPHWNIIAALLIMTFCSFFSFLMNFQNWMRIKKIEEWQKIHANDLDRKLDDFVEKLEKKDDKVISVLEKMESRIERSERVNHDEHLRLANVVNVAAAKLKA